MVCTAHPTCHWPKAGNAGGPGAEPPQGRAHAANRWGVLSSPGFSPFLLRFRDGPFFLFPSASLRLCVSARDMIFPSRRAFINLSDKAVCHLLAPRLCLVSRVIRRAIDKRCLSLPPDEDKEKIMSRAETQGRREERIETEEEGRNAGRTCILRSCPHALLPSFLCFPASLRESLLGCGRRPGWVPRDLRGEMSGFLSLTCRGRARGPAPTM